MSRYTNPEYGHGVDEDAPRSEVVEHSAEDERAVAEFLHRLAEFMSGRTAVCPWPDCGTTVTRSEQVGRCVYLHPCGHRYQGKPRNEVTP